jgi:CheY-like chemotaxis protein
MALPQGDEAQKYLAQIEAVTIRAADLCKQMLAYSGKGRFSVQLLDVSAIVEETTQLLHISIAKGAVLRFNLAKNLPPIKADPTQIRQVVMNLVINASEALGGKSGTISLNTGVVRVDREYLSNTVLADEIPEGDYVFLEVADNGCGMSAETQSHIFEPFYTTKFAGRGLGLSAVLGIVRGHSGAMKVYSESGKGTMFKLLFPVAEGHAQPVQKDAADEAKWRGAGSILIVDDEETVRAVCARMVESFGFKVILAADGTEGVALFRERRAEISAVLMDLTMPHVDGEEAFRQIRAMDPGAHVLLMSGFNEQEAIDRFTGKGLAGFLQKPFRTEQLRAKLRQLLAGA